MLRLTRLAVSCSAELFGRLYHIGMQGITIYHIIYVIDIVYIHHHISTCGHLRDPDNHFNISFIYSCHQHHNHHQGGAIDHDTDTDMDMNMDMDMEQSCKTHIVCNKVKPDMIGQ